MQATESLADAVPLSRTDAAAWLRLAETPHVGPVAAKALLAEEPDPAAIFAADAATLAAWMADAMPASRLEAAVNALRSPPAEFLDEVNRKLEQALLWAGQPGRHLLPFGDSRYPQQLKEIADPPVLLYIEGNPELLARQSVGIVGARNASAQGISHAEQFAAGLSAQGLTVVSGLALGIDAAAHRGGLSGPGSTVAVIGAGIDVAYPVRNLALMRRIAGQGCIVSEYPLGTPPRPEHFPKRNRILSGLTLGVLVVEAAEQSGSLITARRALDQGRDVMAIPGSIHSPLARGCHKLLREGAILVESVGHVLEALLGTRQDSGPTRAQRTAALQGELAELLVALGHDPAPAEVLARRAGLPLSEAQGHLLALELAGMIERLPGGIYQRLQN